MPWANTDMRKLFTWVFQESEADIVCFQELWSIQQRKFLQEYVQVYGWKVCFPSDPCWVGSLLKGLDCGSGLAILYRSEIELLEIPYFERYLEQAGVDKFITKGFYSMKIKYQDIIFTIINTHLQSDFTEVPCCRIRYKFSRLFQEFSLYSYCKKLQTPVIVCGDFNMEKCSFFKFLETQKHITFPETGEHLDHICVMKDEKSFHLESSKYFDDILYSDHIPVRFTISYK